MNILGLDISANRIAWATADGSGTCSTHLIRRAHVSFGCFIDFAAAQINRILMSDQPPDAVCLEINLHPNITHKGHPSAAKVRAYMRSRWVEGAIIQECLHEEPQIIDRVRGGYYRLPKGKIFFFALQASGKVGSKEKDDRRRRMGAIYGLAVQEASQDEVDALAVAHEGVVALKTGISL